MYDCLNSLFYYNSTKLIASRRAVPMSLDMSNKVLLVPQKLSAITVSYDTDYLNFLLDSNLQLKDVYFCEKRKADYLLHGYSC